jgi:hypothetical protein
MKLRAIISAACLLASSSTVNARSVFIGIDRSSTSPVMNEAYAAVAAEYVHGVVAKLQSGDEIHIRTFADRSAVHAKGHSLRLGRKLKPEMAAYQIAQYIRAQPSKPLQAASQTQILAFLELSSLRCDENPLVIVLTDGLESSPGIREKDLLSGKKKLPPPDVGILKGCEIRFHGLGRSDGSITREQVKKLRAAWSTWMDIAGAKFIAITD